ncbi:hypothetical protein ACNKHW_15150 [Shigella flexneri]
MPDATLIQLQSQCRTHQQPDIQRRCPAPTITSLLCLRVCCSPESPINLLSLVENQQWNQRRAMPKT